MKEDKLLKLMKRVNLPDNETSRRYIQKVLETMDDTQGHESESNQRPWVGLTDEEQIAIAYKANGNEIKAVQLAEAKLKEKNT